MGNSFPLSSERRRFIRRRGFNNDYVKSPTEFVTAIDPKRIGEYDSEEVCVSCLENPIQSELSCGHRTLCYRCLYEWIQIYNNKTCPICRARVKYIRIPYVLKFQID